MRNLKKILALVLALVMSLSLVTIANAADFSDSDDISYEEAVDVMSTIGVIEGFEDGSFDPDGTLTREQAATLVTRMLLGDNADRLGIESSTFNDVAVDRWSAPYIEYCVSLGLIDGAGDGNFYPAGQLTGYAFAKILLTAIGYSSEKEGLTGTSWSVNTAALAMDVGLDEGLENGISSAVLSREEAAQMALNAIKTPLVAYDNDATVTVNGAEVAIGGGDAYYITTTLAREQRISDERLSNSNDYTVEFGEKYFPNLRLNREADEFERPSHTWIYNGDEIGSYTDYDLQIASYTEAITGRDLYDLLGKSTIEDYGIAYYVDGAESDVIRQSNMIRTNTRDYDTTGNGVLTQVFVDHTHEEITITSVNTYLAVADADYNESRGEVSLTVYYEDADGTSKTVDVEDIDTITDITEGEFMLVNMAAIGSGSDPYEVVRVNDVESMEDCTVTRYSKGSYVTVDGERYDYAEKAFYDDDVLDEYNVGSLDNYTYTFFMDQYGYVIGAEIYEGEANYLFLTGYDMNGSNLSVSTATAGAIFLDGSFEEIQVDVQDTNDNIDECNKDAEYTCGDYYELSRNGNPNAAGVYDGDDGESEYNRWFRYTVDDNEVYTLTPAQFWVNEEAEVDGQEINSANVRVGLGSNRAYGNDASVYITVDTGAVDLTTQTGITKVNGTYTGVQEVDLRIDSKNDNKLEDDTGIFALYDEDQYIIGAIVVGEDSNNTQNYAYILDTEAQSEYTEDGDTFWDVEAIVDNEIVTLTVANYEGAIKPIQNTIHRERGALYRVTYNADGHVIEAELCTDQEYADIDPDVDDYVYGNLVERTKDSGDYDYNTRDVDPDIDSVYNVEHVDDQFLSLRGRTLYIGDTNDYGLFLASGANIFVVQYETDENDRSELSVEQYTSPNAALNSLKDDEHFDGSISAVLTDAGTAAYLVINSDSDIPVDTDDGTTSSNMVEDGDGQFRLWGSTNSEDNILARAESVAYNENTDRVDYSFTVIDLDTNKAIAKADVTYDLEVYVNNKFSDEMEGLQGTTTSRGLIYGDFYMAAVKVNEDVDIYITNVEVVDNTDYNTYYTLTIRDTYADLIDDGDASVWVDDANVTSRLTRHETVDDLYYTYKVVEGSQVIHRRDSGTNFTTGTYKVNGVDVVKTGTRVTIANMTNDVELSNATLGTSTQYNSVTLHGGIVATYTEGTETKTITSEMGTVALPVSVSTLTITDVGEGQAVIDALVDTTAVTSSVTVSNGLNLYSATQVQVVNSNITATVDGNDINLSSGATYVAIGQNVALSETDSRWTGILVSNDNDVQHGDAETSFTVEGKDKWYVRGANQLTLNDVKATYTLGGTAQTVESGDYVAYNGSLNITLAAETGKGTGVIETTNGQISGSNVSSVDGDDLTGGKTYSAAVTVATGAGVTVTKFNEVPGAAIDTIVNAGGSAVVAVGAKLIANGATEMVVDGVTTSIEVTYVFTAGTDNITFNP